jgi:hypothetical protein
MGGFGNLGGMVEKITAAMNANKASQASSTDGSMLQQSGTPVQRYTSGDTGPVAVGSQYASPEMSTPTQAGGMANPMGGQRNKGLGSLMPSGIGAAMNTGSGVDQTGGWMPQGLGQYFNNQSMPGSMV